MIIGKYFPLSKKAIRRKSNCLGDGWLFLNNEV
jgi:hypothetical protein